MNNLLLDLISRNNNPSKGEWIFVSNTHQRYENNEPVMGLQKGHTRNIKIEKNISGNEGYSVTILNPNPNSFTGSITMTTKPMKIIENKLSLSSIMNFGFGFEGTSDNYLKDEIELKGFGNDRLSGSPFSDYGLTIYLKEGKPNKIALHMNDRNVDIEYLP